MQHLARITAFAALTVAVTVFMGRPAHSTSTSCLVSTLTGGVQGVDHGAACAYFGIPYAAAPDGDRRWTPPRPAIPWTTPRNAATPAAGCPTTQLPAGTLTGVEDCLKMNIWTVNPNPDRPAPVIVWLHTGGFFGASSNFASHNGERLAIERGVVVVAPNYRLGPFGFLAHPALGAEDASYPASGNYGLMDQQAALAWVRDNIAQFGGDPGNVTLAGTSAGGDSVGLQLVSPGSLGLFHRAIVQSGSPTIRWPSRTEAESQGLAFGAALGCVGPGDVLACMRSKTVPQVLLALPQAAQQVAEPAAKTYWLPHVDGVTIPDQPRWLLERGAFQRVPTLVGTNRDEGWGAFVTRSFPSGVDAAQYEAWMAGEFADAAPELLDLYPVAHSGSPTETLARVVTDVQFVCEGRRLARLIERTKTPVFVYSYEYEIDDLSADHVIHGVESNIVFGNNYVPPQFLPHALDASDMLLHDTMAGYWSRFAATGNPNSDDPAVAHWPAFTHPAGDGRGADKYLVFDAILDEARRARETQCDALAPFFFRSLVAGVPAGLR
jgi:para-nitrobenzyl esterase